MQKGACALLHSFAPLAKKPEPAEGTPLKYHGPWTKNHKHEEKSRGFNKKARGQKLEASPQDLIHIQLFKNCGLFAFLQTGFI